MTQFEQTLYELVKLIPAGKVITYGSLAKALGSVNLSRAVGNALHKNPYAFTEENLKNKNPKELVPCHRVVNAKGMLAENFGYGGKVKQKEMLQKEGVLIHDFKVDLSKYLFHL